MPLYTTLCPGCGSRDHIFRKVAERDSLPSCACGWMVRRVIEAPMVQTEIQPYLSPNGSTLIDSRQKRREDLSRSNAYAWEPGIEKDISRRKADELDKSFKPISDAVDTIVRDMATCGKLEN